MSDKVELSTGSPESFGWQRRPDLDTSSSEVWERPNGMLWAWPKNGPKPIITRLPSIRKWFDECSNHEDKTT